ncbi:MAG: peptidoglycan DD-metalloendopeptidase family protein [Dehalococcoidia bacterium]
MAVTVTLVVLSVRSPVAAEGIVPLPGQAAETPLYGPGSLSLPGANTPVHFTGGPHINLPATCADPVNPLANDGATQAGLDFVVSDAEVRAMKTGTASFVGELGQFGWVIVIDSWDSPVGQQSGWSIMYAHLAQPGVGTAPNVQVGQRYHVGDHIATQSNTGCGSCGVHLHVHFLWKGKSYFPDGVEIGGFQFWAAHVTDQHRDAEGNPYPETWILPYEGSATRGATSVERMSFACPGGLSGEGIFTVGPTPEDTKLPISELPIGGGGSGEPPPSSGDGIEVVAVSSHNLNPGEQFSPTVTVRVFSGQLLPSRGDHLHATPEDSSNVFGAWPVQPIRSVVNAGGTYTFDLANDSGFQMTAPTTPGNYQSTWQLRVGGQHIGPPIVIRITVGGGEPQHGVRFCDGTNGGGPCVTLTEGRWNDLSQLSSGNWSDRIESLEFVGNYVGGYHVVLQTETNLNGNPYHADNNVGDLGEAHRNHIRSIEIYSRFPGGSVQLCDGTGFGEPCQSFGVGKYNNLADQGWYDRAESVRFVGDYAGAVHVVLLTEVNLGGNPYHADVNVSDLGETHRNHIRSLEIYCTGVGCPAPTPLGPLTGQNYDENDSVILRWSNTGTNFRGEVFGGPEGTIEFGPLTTTSYALGTLTPGYTYQWRVKSSHDIAESGWSTTETFTIVPQAPANLLAGLGSCSAVDLLWDDQSAVEDGYRIYVNGEAVAATAGPNLLTYTYTNPLVAGRSYTFAVAAFSGVRNSLPSNEVTIVAPEHCLPQGQDSGALFGDGSDGSLVVGAGQVTYVPATAPNNGSPLAASAAAGSTSISVARGSDFEIGDEVLIHQTQSPGNAGTYEFAFVTDISGSVLTLDGPLGHAFTQSGDCASITGCSRAQVRVVPHYSNVTVQDGGTLVCRPWKAGIGEDAGGICAFRVAGAFTIEPGGVFSLAGGGFLKSFAKGYGTTQSAESFDHGIVDRGYGCVFTTISGDGAQGRGYRRAGGGGGYGTAGTPGDGTEDCGGQGGAMYGTTDLSRVNLGSGGGASDWFDGGNGGGAVMVFASEVAIGGRLSVDGAAGATATSNRCSLNECDPDGAGGGSGGSALIVGGRVAIGIAAVTAGGGPGGQGFNTGADGGYWGGTGGAGRIRVEYCESFTGASYPSASVEPFVCEGLPNPPPVAAADETSTFGTGDDASLSVASGQTQYTDDVRSPLTASVAAGAVSITVSSSAGLGSGDEVLVIQSAGTGTGTHEFRRVLRVEGQTVHLNKALSSPFTVGGSAKAQVIRVPNYASLTVASGGLLTAHPWNGSTGGVVTFRVRDDAVVSGKVHADGLGYRGGPQHFGTSLQGESELGPGAGSCLPNGSGGGAGRTSNYGNPPGGGGGGHAQTGTAGDGGINNGGMCLGQGALANSVSTSSTLNFGGGGGSGGAKLDGSPGLGLSGGNGGGVLYAAARSLTVNGVVSANGANGTGGQGYSNYGAAGGGGAGGTVSLLTQDGVVGVNRLSAVGAPGWTSAHGEDRDGGWGGNGKVLLSYCRSLSGASRPAAVVLGDHCQRGPAIAAAASARVTEGKSIAIPVTATDPDASILTFSGIALPPFVSVDDRGDGTAFLVVNPLAQQHSGAYNLLVTVSDGFSGAGTSIALTVDPAPPPLGRHHLSALDLGAELLVVGRNSSGQQWARETESQEFGPWKLLGSGAASRPEAVRSGTSDFVFFRTMNGALGFVVRTGGGAWAPGNLGGTFVGDPAAAGDADGDIIVTVRNAASQLWVRRYTSGAWSPWSRLDGALAGSLQMTAYGPDIYLFGLGNQGQSWARRWASSTDGWQPWESLGGTVQPGVSAAETPAGNLLYVAVNAAGEPWSRELGGSGWGPWTRLSGTIASPAALGATSNSLLFAGINAARNLWTRQHSGTSWGPWTFGAGVLATDAEVGTTGNDAWVFAVATGGKPWFRRWDGSSWGPWTSLGGTLAIE